MDEVKQESKTAAALKKYTDAFTTMRALREANGDIFGQDERNVARMDAAEEEVIEAALVENVEVSNRTFQVKIRPQTQKVYDEEKIKSKNYQSIDEVVSEQSRPARVVIVRKPTSDEE